MRFFGLLSFVWLACSPPSQSTFTVQADPATAIANGTDAVTITATISGNSPSYADFTVSSGGQLTASRASFDSMGNAKTGLTATTAGNIIVTATLSAPRSGANTTSTTVTFTAPAGPRLRFQSSPSNTLSQNLLRPIPVVAVEDANGAVMTSSTASVTVAVDPGSCSASLDSTSMMTVSAVNGLASFYGLKITTPITGCRLKATSGTLDAAISTSFDILP